jgi:hypothetical protein
VPCGRVACRLGRLARSPEQDATIVSPQRVLVLWDPEHDDPRFDVEHLRPAGQFDQGRLPVGVAANDER